MHSGRKRCRTNPLFAFGEASISDSAFLHKSPSIAVGVRTLHTVFCLSIRGSNLRPILSCCGSCFSLFRLCWTEIQCLINVMTPQRTKMAALFADTGTSTSRQPLTSIAFLVTFSDVGGANDLPPFFTAKVQPS